MAGYMHDKCDARSGPRTGVSVISSPAAPPPFRSDALPPQAPSPGEGLQERGPGGAIRMHGSPQGQAIGPMVGVEDLARLNRR
jgi:hypothetical protein